MPNHPLFYPPPQTTAAPLHDQIQIALAIADANALRLLLTHSIPPLSPPHLIGEISVELSVPNPHQGAADAVLHFEAVKYALAPDFHHPGEQQAMTSGWTRDRKEFARLTRCESEVHTIGEHIALAPTVALLTNAGLSSEQVNEILNLPNEVWHKSWWYALDEHGYFSLPFLRYIRALRYANGTFTLQHRDFFEQNEPVCFRTQQQKVLVVIQPEIFSFSQTLKEINCHRDALKIDQALLICNSISELEAQGFISQGVSLYPAVELMLPSQSNCTACARGECPMNGTINSPVALCYGFMPSAEYL